MVIFIMLFRSALEEQRIVMSTHLPWKRNPAAHLPFAVLPSAVSECGVNNDIFPLDSGDLN